MIILPKLAYSRLTWVKLPEGGNWTIIPVELPHSKKQVSVDFWQWSLDLYYQASPETRDIRRKGLERGIIDSLLILRSSAPRWWRWDLGSVHDAWLNSTPSTQYKLITPVTLSGGNNGCTIYFHPQIDSFICLPYQLQVNDRGEVFLNILQVQHPFMSTHVKRKQDLRSELRAWASNIPPPPLSPNWPSVGF